MDVQANRSDLVHAGGVPAFEAGWYPGVIDKVEFQDSKHGQKIVFTCRVRNPQGKTRQVRAHACIESREDYVRGAGMKLLISAGEATGAIDATDKVTLADTVGKPLDVRLTKPTMEINGTPTPVNFVAEFAARTSNGAPPAAPQQPPVQAQREAGPPGPPAPQQGGGPDFSDDIPF